MGGPTIHPSLLVPLAVMAAAYAMFFLALWLAAMKAEIIKRRIHQMQIAEAAMKIDTAFLHARRAADDLDRYAQDNRLMDVTARARVRMDTALAAKYCRDAVEILVAAHGTSSLADSNRMQRLWRDVHTASHHAITEWQVNLEVYGKALLGVEPNITHLI